jgi:hypothetical protein
MRGNKSNVEWPATQNVSSDEVAALFAGTGAQDASPAPASNELALARLQDHFQADVVSTNPLAFYEAWNNWVHAEAKLIGLSITKFSEVWEDGRQAELWRARYDSYLAYLLAEFPAGDSWTATRRRAHYTRLEMLAAGQIGVLDFVTDAAFSELALVPPEDRGRVLEQARADGGVTEASVRKASGREIRASGRNQEKNLALTHNPQTPQSQPAPGQCRINGVVQPDTPYIAAQRAAGMYLPGSVPDVTEEEPKPETDRGAEEQAEREPGDPGTDARRAAAARQSDEVWAMTLPLASQLNGMQRDIFIRDAIDWRNMCETAHKVSGLDGHLNAFVAFREQARKVQRESRYKWPGGSVSPRSFAYYTSLYLGNEEPSHWILCPPIDKGGCGGTGTRDITGQCTICDGKGYRVPISKKR